MLSHNYRDAIILLAENAVAPTSSFRYPILLIHCGKGSSLGLQLTEYIEDFEPSKQDVANE